jgi:hypothetical protein
LSADEDAITVAEPVGELRVEKIGELRVARPATRAPTELVEQLREATRGHGK